MREEQTYSLPAIGKPAEPPMLRKIALEEHFNYIAPGESGANAALQDVIRKMDYNETWFASVSQRLVEFGEKRLAGMDASGIDMSILSMTVPGIQGIVNAAEAVSRARAIN